MPSVYNKPFVENKPAVFFATVMSTKDPLKIGRVQVSLRSLDKPVEMPWLRVLQTQASKGFGSYCLPEKGDVVSCSKRAWRKCSWNDYTGRPLR